MALTLHGTVSDNTVALDRKTATPIIINGDMAIAQRGTSATTIGNGNSGYHVCDRWRFSENGAPTGEFTISQSTDVPTGQGFSSSLKWDVTTADTSLAVQDMYRLEHRTEAQDMQVLKYGTSSAETLTLSFWVRSNKTGNYAFNIRKNDDLRNLTKTYTINSADTWEKKVINIPAETSGAINNDNGIGLQMFWIFATGTDFTGTTQETWGAYADGSQAQGQAVNLLDSTSNDWYITGVQLEVGTFDSNSIPPFQFEDRATSLARCQRYYVRQEKQSTNQIVCVGMCTSTTNSFGEYYYPQVMRAAPTFSYSAIGDLQCVRTGGNTNPTSVQLQNASNIVGNIKSVVSSGFTAGSAMFLRFDSDAVSTPPQYIEFDSEL